MSMMSMVMSAQMVVIQGWLVSLPGTVAESNLADAGFRGADSKRINGLPDAYGNMPKINMACAHLISARLYGDTDLNYVVHSPIT